MDQNLNPTTPDKPVIPPPATNPAQPPVTPQPVVTPPPTVAPVTLGAVVQPPGYVTTNVMPAGSLPLPDGSTNSPNTPGIIVLQWLTYAFWGWTVLAMSFLTGTVLSSLILGSDASTFIQYEIAAVLVLLPLSLTCDYFYSKNEPPKKTGAASIVMVIHAVIFALLGIGGLIAIVFSLVSLATSISNTSSTAIALYTSLIVTALYAMVFLRTLNPTAIP